MPPVPPLRRVEIRKQACLLDDFFKINEVVVSHERFDGTMSPGERRLIFERGHSVAVLLLNLDRKAVVLVDQFKLPALIGRRYGDPNTTDGWITEAIAGMIDPGETPRAAAIRETMEETGYEISNPKLISTFFSSPGGTSERIFLFFAEVSDADRHGPGGGVGGEDIRMIHLPVDELFDHLSQGRIEDPKLAIAGYWLQTRLKARQDRSRFLEAMRVTVNELFDRLATPSISSFDFGEANEARLKQEERRLPSATSSAAEAPATSSPLGLSTVQYRFKHNPELIIGYKTGSIDDIRGVSIWVNSENTNMMMDRVIGRTISAKIRLLGANRDQHDNIIEDTIAESLRSALGQRAHVGLGTVLVTESGALKATHQVQRIFHVATVESGGLEFGMNTDVSKLKLCIVKLLTRVDEENNRLLRLLFARRPFQSILIPLLGSGDGGVPVEEAADIVVSAAVNHLASLPQTTLRQVYFLAFKPRDKAACDRALERLCRDGSLDRGGNDS